MPGRWPIGYQPSTEMTDTVRVEPQSSQRRRGAAIRRPLLPALAVGVLALCAVVLASALPGAVSAGVHPRGEPEIRILTTTGPIPPATVKPATGPHRAVAVAAGEVVVSGVPAYIWHDGCAPTSTGMVLGYWDGHGFPDLIPGDASTPTLAVNQAIASHGTAAAPRHYEDYALPSESASAPPTGRTTWPDKSEDPEGDEHASDSVADFMHTSWSDEGLRYGWSYTSMVGPAFAAYVGLRRLTGVTASYTDYHVGSFGSWSFTFDVLKREIDAGRPMVLYVDSSSDGVSDHAVAGIGYRETNGYPEYACWDTWTAAMRWERFRDVSSSYGWGVSGATALSLTESGSPPPVVDMAPPVTTVSGAGTGWRQTDASLILPATDEGSGVAFTEASLDTPDLARLPDLPGTLDARGQGVHVVRYRSTDNDGNVEVTRTCTVKIDAGLPVTSVRAASVRRGARVTLRYRVDDLTPKASVRLVIRTLAGQRRATLRPGWRGTNAERSLSWRCTLARGSYRVAVFATDQAGNRQSTAGSARLTVH
jgi:hypothetical protein